MIRQPYIYVLNQAKHLFIDSDDSCLALPKVESGHFPISVWVRTSVISKIDNVPSGDVEDLKLAGLHTTPYLARVLTPTNHHIVNRLAVHHVISTNDVIDIVHPILPQPFSEFATG